MKIKEENSDLPDLIYMKQTSDKVAATVPMHLKGAPLGGPQRGPPLIGAPQRAPQMGAPQRAP